MKIKSGIAAIMLSLSIAGSAQAANPILAWFGSLVTLNVMQYAVPYANLYLTYRNGKKIDAVSKQVTQLGTAVNAVDGKVTEVDTKVTNLQQTVNTLDTHVTTGFSKLNTDVAGLRDALHTTDKKVETVNGVVHATAETLTKFKATYTQDMKNLGEQIDTRFNEVSVQMAENESRRQKDTEMLKAQSAETVSMLKSFEGKLTTFEEFSQHALDDIASIKTMLQTLVSNKSQIHQEEKKQ